MEEPSPRFNHILSPVGGRSFLLAGQTDPFESEEERDRVVSILSVFDHETKQWEHRKINVDNKPPGMRSGGYVTHGKVIYSFGGREDTGLGRYNTLHKFDTEELRWIAFPPNIHSYAEAPMPKSGCEPVIIEDKLCLFGGFGTHTATGPLQPGSRFETDEGVYDRGNTNEFHLYNLRDVAVPFWISGQVTGDRPPPCSYYTLTLVDSRRAVMFGGNTNTGRINDVYTMTVDGTNVNFRKIKKFGPWPERRSSHAACVLNHDQEFPQLLVAGGLDNNKDPIGDLWLFSVDHGMWMKLDTELKVSDPERYLQRWRPTLSCVSRERRASVVLFGGVNKDGYKVALTTLLEFKFVENCEVPQWILEDVIPVEDNSSNTPQRVLTNPIQAVDNDEEQPYNYV